MKISFAGPRPRPAGAGSTRREPGLPELRAALVAMAAILGGSASVILLVPASQRRTDFMLQAVMLALSFARTARAADLLERTIGVALLPAIATMIAAAHALVFRHPIIDDAFLVMVVFVSIWIRRFGPRAGRIGIAAALPVVAILVVRTTASSPGDAYALWMGVAALSSALWVCVLQWVARRSGFIADAPPPKPAAAEVLPAPAARAPGPPRMLPSTRMALQMGAALIAASVIGCLVVPAHAEWAMITAFIVCSGARGRGDVVYKAALRVVGAVIGTAAGTWLAWVFGPRNAWAIVAIFAILTVATWLRSRNYAYWAGGFTAALALLYSLHGDTSPALLVIRLKAIMIGALLGVAGSSLLFPIKTADIARRRIADALAALADLIGPEAHAPDSLARRRTRFEDAIEQIEQISAPLQAHRRLFRVIRSRPQIADAIDGVRQCGEPAGVIARETAAGNVAAEAEIDRLKAELLANINAIRRAIGRRPGPPCRPLQVAEFEGTGPILDEGRDPTRPQMKSAIREIDAALARLARVFVPDAQERVGK